MGQRRRLLATAAALLLAGMLLAGRAQAAEGDTRAGLFLGTTTFQAGGDQTFGTTFGFNYGYEFVDNLQWDASAFFSSTDGKATDDNGQQQDIRAVNNEVRTGLTAYFNRGRGSNVVPFVGGGVSALFYDIRFAYAGSEVGNTSGTAPGAYVEGGVELRLTRSVTFIPQFGYQTHVIKTEAGKSLRIQSFGLVLSLRIST